MAIQNPVLSRDGLPLLNRHGGMVVGRVGGAPNGADLGETVTVFYDAQTEPTVAIDIPAVDPSYSQATLVFKGADAGGALRQHTFPIVNPVAGRTTLGTISEVMGPLADADNLPVYEVCITNASGVGVSVGLKSLTESQTPDTPAILNSVTIVGDPMVGEELTYSYDWEGFPEPSVTAVSWKRNGVEVATTDAWTVAGSAGQTVTVTLTISNGVGDPSTLESAAATITSALSAPTISDVAISGSGEVDTLVSVTYTFDRGNPEATASIQWKKDTVAIPGAIGNALMLADADYDPGDSITCTVSATNSEGTSSDTSDPVVVSGSPTNTAPVITSHVVSGSGLVGAALTSTVIATGTPTPTITRQWTADNVNISGATSATYTPVSGDVGKAIRCAATATNSVDSFSLTSNAITASLEVPAQLTETQWNLPTGIAKPTVSSTAFGMDTIQVLNSIGATEIQWTTQATGTDDELSWEACTIGSVQGTWRNFTTDPAVHGSWDWKNFDFTNRSQDQERAGRVRIRYRKGASLPWSPSTAVKRVQPPDVIQPPQPSTTLWERVMFRSEAQKNAGDLGGAGYQFMRSWGYSEAAPDRVVFVMDVLPAIKTESFGDYWEPLPSAGLWAGRSADACEIDYQDGNRILIYGSMSTKRNSNSWNRLGGMYLSTDGGETFSHRVVFEDAQGSGENGSGGKKDGRFSRNTLCQVRSGTPSTRTWYVIQRMVAAQASSVSANYVWKSTDGGSSWTRGQSLAPGTYGQDITQLVRKNSNGWFYLCGGDGGGGLRVCKGDPASASFTALNVPGGSVRWCDVNNGGNNVVLALTNSGLYKNTNNGEGASGTWTQLISGSNWVSFAVSPHDPDLILINGQNAVVPKRTVNGGSSWHTMRSQAYPGEPGGFEHQLWASHSKFIFHATDPKLCICCAKQHIQICRDINNPGVSGGSSTPQFVFGSAGFDAFDVQGACLDPDNMGNGNILVNATDRLAAMFIGSTYVVDSQNDANWEPQAASGHVGGAGGCIWLRSPNGSQDAKLTTANRSQSTEGSIVRFTGNASNPIQTGSVVQSMTGPNNGYAQHPTDKSKGVLGRAEITLANGGGLTVNNLGRDLFGYDSEGRKYGVSGSTISRHDGSWSNFCTCVTSPEPYDGSAWFSVDHNHANRLIYPTNNGRLRRVTGAPGNQTDVVIFDLRNYTSGVPSSGSFYGSGYSYDYRLFRCAIDNWHSGTRAAVSAYHYGGPSIWITDDFTVASPVWTDITDHRIRMGHQLSFLRDGTLFTGSLGGTAVYPRLGGAANNDVYSRVKAFNDQIDAPD